MPLSAPLMMEMIHAVASTGVTPIVRIPNHDVSWVKWALDAGAQGIMVPMVNTKEQMETIIRHSKYPPWGQRSSGATWSKFGWPGVAGQQGYAGGAEYAQGADREILIIPQIETKEAVDNVDSILSVKGVDMAFVGPFDLHLSLGLAPSGEGAEPEFMDAIGKVLAACKKHGVASGIFTTSGAAAKMRVEQGFQVGLKHRVVVSVSELTCSFLSKSSSTPPTRLERLSPAWLPKARRTRASRTI